MEESHTDKNLKFSTWPNAQTMHTGLDLFHSAYLSTVCFNTNKSPFNPTWMRHLLTSLAQRALLQVCDLGTHIRNTREARVSTTEDDFMVLRRNPSVTARKLKTKPNTQDFNSKANGRSQKKTSKKHCKSRISCLCQNPWGIIWKSFSKIKHPNIRAWVAIFIKGM